MNPKVTLSEASKLFTDEFMSIPPKISGVVGVGMGENKLVVYVMSHAVKNIPAEYMGYKTQAIVSGEFFAL